eukprot:g51634.t1
MSQRKEAKSPTADFLKRKRERGQLTDVVFLLGTARVPAHRLVLAASSPIFELILYPLSAQGNPIVSAPKLPLEVKVSHTTGQAKPFETFINCIYDDSYAIPKEQVVEVQTLANKYECHRVKLSCLEALNKDVTEENCFELFLLGPSVYQNPLLALDVVAKHAGNVMQTSEFKTCAVERLKTFLSCPELDATEIEIFKAVLAWGATQLEKQKAEGDTGATLKSVLRDVLPLIRFPTMELKEIAAVVAPAEVLDLPVLTQLFTYAALAGPGDRTGAIPELLKGFPSEPRCPDSWSSIPRCRLMHDMKLVTYSPGKHNVAEYEVGWICDICGQENEVMPDQGAKRYMNMQENEVMPDQGTKRFHCETCKADICVRCHSKKRGTPTDKKGHEMRLSGFEKGQHNPEGYRSGWVCDICGLRSHLASAKLAAHRYWCPTCQTDICLTCHWAGKQLP